VARRAHPATSIFARVTLSPAHPLPLHAATSGAPVNVLAFRSRCHIPSHLCTHVLQESLTNATADYMTDEELERLRSALEVCCVLDEGPMWTGVDGVLGRTRDISAGGARRLPLTQSGDVYFWGGAIQPGGQCLLSPFCRRYPGPSGDWLPRVRVPIVDPRLFPPVPLCAACVRNGVGAECRVRTSSRWSHRSISSCSTLLTRPAGSVPKFVAQKPDSVHIRSKCTAD
jgi:hypothetical protein